jgi:hypothetical protein
MSLEMAQQFVARMREDREFRTTLEHTEDDEILHEQLLHSGYRFTEQELVGAMASCMRELERTDDAIGAPSSATAPQADRGAKLEDLIPVAVVIAAGCEPCAERMVGRALEQGSSARQVRKTLALIEGMCRLACLAEAVGAEGVERMEGPLEAGRRALQAHVSEASGVRDLDRSPGGRLAEM